MEVFKPQTSFLGGELDPLIQGRIDLKEKYEQGLLTATNVKINNQGSVSRRNGTIFIAEAKSSTNRVRLLRFQPTVSEGYILELGDYYMRFFANETNIVTDLTFGGYDLIDSDGNTLTYGVTDVVTPWPASAIQNITYAQFQNTMSFACDGYPPQILTKFNDSDWSLVEDVEAIPATSQQGSFVTGQSLSYSATSGSNVTFTASGSVFLASDVGRQLINITDNEAVGTATIITYTSDTQVIANITQTFPSGPLASGKWVIAGTPVVQLSTTATSSQIASIIVLTSDQDAFRSVDINSFIIIHNGIVQITSVDSATQVTCMTIRKLDVLGPTYNWQLEQPDWSAANGYPRTVCFFEQRKVYGGSTKFPHRLWMSALGSYNDFGVVANDAGALSLDIAEPETGIISWLRPGRNLMIGTSLGELSLSTTGAVTVSNPGRLISQTTMGGIIQTPISIKNKVMFIQADGKKLQSLAYDFRIDGYFSTDVFYAAEHLTKTDPIVEVIYAIYPQPKLYTITTSGNLLVCTWHEEDNTIAWVKHTTTGTFESVARVTYNNTDQVWVAVNRTINGVTKRYVELFDSGDGTNSGDIYSDSAITVSSYTASVTGLTALAAATVEVKGDGLSLGTFTINSSGVLTLPVGTHGSLLTIGLPYTSTIQTLPKEVNPQTGSLTGQYTRFPRPVLKVYQSAIPVVNGQSALQNTAPATDSFTPPLYDGILTYGPTAWDRSATLNIIASGPYPFNLLGIFGSTEGNAI